MQARLRALSPGAPFPGPVAAAAAQSRAPLARQRDVSCLLEGLPVQTWLKALSDDFSARLIALLSGAFRDMAPATALALLQPKLTYSNAESQRSGATAAVRRVSGQPLDAHDLKRLHVRPRRLRPPWVTPAQPSAAHNACYCLSPKELVLRTACCCGWCRAR